ncbi:tRNA pseudouridine synthase 1 [Geranomyces variabilis]|uniref:tRNA pseudouridine synthase 1 n=1 Tax=Geranomyces variabilis TaxID=109894 RepID=A0AAD5TPJ8_9FUNG|nr:tRNA pseudouridine synthase 1 [Geranomyces variabilis]
MPEPTAAATRRVAVLYAYNGSQFQGLERTKGLKTIEGTLLSAIATIIGESDPNKRVSLVNISRASTTEKGEHAARQVLSLEIAGAEPNAPLPTAANLAPLLPESIKVFDVVLLNTSFSARRTCDTRCYEYLIPTYVLAPPPQETHYAYPPVTDEEFDEQWPENENLGPPGGLFKTIKRGMSVKRTKSTRTGTVNRGKSLNRMASRSVPAAEFIEPTQTKSAGNTYAAGGSAYPPAQEPEKKGGFMKFFQTLTRGGKKSSSSHDNTSSPDLARSKSKKTYSTQAAPASFSSPNLAQPNAHFATSAPTDEDFGMMATLKRSVSRRSRRDPELASLNGEATEERQGELAPEYFDPLNLQPETEEELSLIRQYRVTADQLKAMNHIISIFNGTHNWHNYIPGAKYEDSRCYMRIINIDCSAPEVHFGMEWVRVKVQAKAFARYQVRKMMAMAIMVIRTNTPRSVVANSFGYTNIDIPEAPGFGLILDEPFYDTFNSDCERRGDPKGVHFNKHQGPITEFRHHRIHDAIYRAELETMAFVKWTRNLDAYSFLYTYFLNERGVVVPPRNLVSKKAVAAENERLERERRAKANDLFVQE